MLAGTGGFGGVACTITENSTWIAVIAADPRARLTLLRPIASSYGGALVEASLWRRALISVLLGSLGSQEDFQEEGGALRSAAGDERAASIRLGIRLGTGVLLIFVPLRLEPFFSHRLNVACRVQNRTQSNGREEVLRGAACPLDIPVQVPLREGVEPGPTTGEIGDRLGLDFLLRLIGARAVPPRPAARP